MHRMRHSVSHVLLLFMLCKQVRKGSETAEREGESCVITVTYLIASDGDKSHLHRQVLVSHRWGCQRGGRAAGDPGAPADQLLGGDSPAHHQLRHLPADALHAAAQLLHRGSACTHTRNDSVFFFLWFIEWLIDFWFFFVVVGLGLFFFSDCFHRGSSVTGPGATTTSTDSTTTSTWWLTTVSTSVRRLPAAASLQSLFFPLSIVTFFLNSVKCTCFSTSM